LVNHLAKTDLGFIVIGDKKGPLIYDLLGVELFTLQQQNEMHFEMAKILPSCHYARKNIGYLVAMSRGASFIYETDDDNAPLESWKERALSGKGILVTGEKWVNVYRFFTSEMIWPRGLPLNEIHNTSYFEKNNEHERIESHFPIQQGLADVAPDVDAIWRLIDNRDINFSQNESVVLDRNCWCPFNSQSTWWWPAAYPLLYLPSYCSFRMTDIWRSFIAQRCLWELGYKMIFHCSEVKQLRNDHVIMNDFSDEVVGYLSNQNIRNILTGLKLKEGQECVFENLYKCYEAMVSNGFIGKEELNLVNAWSADLKKIT
jgi:hypothetical protein